MLPVTALYAGVLGFYFVWLSARVIKARRVHRVALGLEHRLVQRAARAQGNFAEYVPFALLMLALCELNGLPDWALHVLGVVLAVGRVLHAVGIGKEPEDFTWRVLGTSLTFTMMGVASAALLGLAAANL
jgi:uncharacterized membrane protein YecN with MAPEG domain